MSDKYEDIKERMQCEADDIRGRRPYRVFVTITSYGYADVMAHSREEAEEIAEDANITMTGETEFEYECEEEYDD